MNKLKKNKILSVLRILKSLDKKDLDYFVENTSPESLRLFLEVVHNLIFNDKLLSSINDKDLLNSIKSCMKVNRKKWSSVVKSRSEKSRRRFVRTQIGSGVISDIASLILPIVLAIL